MEGPGDTATAAPAPVVSVVVGLYRSQMALRGDWGRTRWGGSVSVPQPPTLSAAGSERQNGTRTPRCREAAGVAGRGGGRPGDGCGALQACRCRRAPYPRRQRPPAAAAAAAATTRCWGGGGGRGGLPPRSPQQCGGGRAAGPPRRRQRCLPSCHHRRQRVPVHPARVLRWPAPQPKLTPAAARALEGQSHWQALWRP